MGQAAVLQGVRQMRTALRADRRRRACSVTRDPLSLAVRVVSAEADMARYAVHHLWANFEPFYRSGERRVVINVPKFIVCEGLEAR